MKNTASTTLLAATLALALAGAGLAPRRAHCAAEPAPAVPAVAATSAADDARLPHLSEWVGEPTLARELGPARQISSVITTGDESNHVSISREFANTFEVKKGAELGLGSLLKFVDAKFEVHMSHSASNRSSLQHKISLDRRSRGVVIFRERLIRVRGRAKKTYVHGLICRLGSSLIVAMNHPECFRDSELVDVDVTATELDELGNALGEYTVKYLGTDEFTHPDFYNLANRTAAGAGALRVEGEVRSPRECADRALAAGKLVALYDVDGMRCSLWDAELNNGTILDREGFALGAYNPSVPANSSESSQDAAELARWKSTGACDAIRELRAGTGSRRAARFECRRFAELARHVLMLRRLARGSDGAPGSSGPGGGGGAAALPSDQSRAAAQPGANSDDRHPKFYALAGRTVGPSLGAQTIRNVKSAFACGEHALGSDKFLAVYRAKEHTCALEPVLWNYGRAFTTDGRPLGGYGVRAPPERAQQTDDGETRQNWFAARECDLVHDTDEGVFTCQMFEADAGALLLLRQVDGYESKRINRALRTREFDRLLFSESLHPQFYAIKDKDFPLKCVKTQPNVRSAQACGDLALEEAKFLAVYKPTSQVCVLKELFPDDGQTLDRWNKPLGNYDVPFYDKDSSQSGGDYERWLDLNECDIIHAKDNGWRYCKQFPTTDDSVLMFRRTEKKESQL